MGRALLLFPPPLQRRPRQLRGEVLLQGTWKGTDRCSKSKAYRTEDGRLQVIRDLKQWALTAGRFVGGTLEEDRLQHQTVYGDRRLDIPAGDRLNDDDLEAAGAAAADTLDLHPLLNRPPERLEEPVAKRRRRG